MRERKRRIAGVRLTEEEADRLREMAERLGMTQAEFMRQAIRLAMGMESTLIALIPKKKKGE